MAVNVPPQGAIRLICSTGQGLPVISSIVSCEAVEGVSIYLTLIPQFVPFGIVNGMVLPFQSIVYFPFAGVSLNPVTV